MSLLDSTTPQRERFLKLFEKYYLKLSLLSFIIGLIWFFILPHSAHVDRTYMSENALSPGLVNSDIEPSDELTRNYETLRELYKKSDEAVLTWIYTEFAKLGIEVYEQNFNITMPFYEAVNKKDHAYLSGKNVYGIARAYRAANVESIVLSAPLYYDDSQSTGDEFERTRTNPFGISQLLAIAKLARSTSYWAKDLVFVVGDIGNFGIQAWLNSYYDVNSKYIQYENLKIRGGAIQAALNLEVNDPKADKYLIKLEGANGQLPNLDLFNTVIRLCQANNFICGLDKVSDTFPNELEMYKESFENMIKMMFRQATGVPNSLHGFFLRHHIEALTLQGVVTKKYPKQNGLRIIRIVEGTLRSINNLLERFHQSFFFYLLPNEKSYVSIGKYMPPLGLLMLPFLVQILHLWLQFFQSPIENIHNTIKIDLLKFVLPDIILAIVFGLINYNGATYFIRSGREFGLEPKYSLLSGHFALFVNSMIAPLFIYRKIKLDPINQESVAHRTYASQIKQLSFKIRKFLATIFLALFISSLSLVNFSLSFFIALLYAPLCILLTQIQDHRYALKLIQKLFLLFVCPFVYFSLLYFVYLYYFEKNFNPFNIYESLVENFYSLYLLSNISNIWTYDLICLGLYPIWLLFWFMTFTPNISDN